MPGALMFIMREYYVVGSWEFVLVFLLNVVYIQSHASAVIALCIDNRTGVLPY